MLELKNITKTYESSAGKLDVLKSISFQIPKGQFVAVVGPSGSGKSTLLGLMAGLDRPSKGSIKIDGKDITKLTEEELATIRNREVGFIFQSFQLIQSFTASENVAVPLELRQDLKAKAKARFLLNELGMDHRRDHYPSQLSGGEQQRVAIARAIIANPSIVFADEPTGNLDSQNGKMVLDTLEQVVRNSGKTLILVTHDLRITGLADRVIELRDGGVIADTTISLSDVSKADLKEFAPKKITRSKASLKDMLLKRPAKNVAHKTKDTKVSAKKGLSKAKGRSKPKTK